MPASPCAWCATCHRRPTTGARLPRRPWPARATPSPSWKSPRPGRLGRDARHPPRLECNAISSSFGCPPSHSSASATSAWRPQCCFAGRLSRPKQRGRSEGQTRLPPPMAPTPSTSAPCARSRHNAGTLTAPDSVAGALPRFPSNAATQNKTRSNPVCAAPALVRARARARGRPYRCALACR